MGYCIACFLRDISGAIGLHRAGVVQYLRPEIVGLGLGAFVIALARGEFKTRGGANPLLRFLLGVMMMIGALVFLGCPLRMTLRLAGGDLNALLGLGGFAAGIYAGVLALRSGYNPGRAQVQSQGMGFAYPVLLVAIFVALMMRPDFVFFSAEGPGSLAAPIWIALLSGLLIGVLAQRSRLCMAGGIRDMILIRDPHLLWGFVAIFVTALAGNLLAGAFISDFAGFNLGFVNQPIAHTAHLWNFLGMAVVGYAAVLAGGCPLRQLILAGEGDTDATLTVFGLIVGAGFAHNFGLAGSAAGVGLNGQIAVVASLVILTLVAFGHKFNISLMKNTKEAA